MTAFLTVEEVAAELHCTPETARKYLRAGSIPGLVTVPGMRRILVKRAEFEAFAGKVTP